jgi:hypothetical protein
VWRPVVPEKSGADTTLSEPQRADFIEVGLSVREAETAYTGLRAGTYISFEDACLSVCGGVLRETEMRKRAKRFIDARARR